MTKRQQTRQLTGINPAELSRQLREGTGGYLAERRGIVGLSFFTIGIMGLISLYQMGIIGHLPEPPLPRLDADGVDASAEAYERFSMPDGFLGVLSYSVTAALAAMDGADRARRNPWIPLALAGKIGLDVVEASRLTWDQWAKHKAFCFWCLLSAVASYAMVPLVWNEARTALRHLRR